MVEKIEEKSTAEKLSDFISKKRVILVSTLVAVLVFCAGFAIFAGIKTKIRENGIEKIENLENEFEKIVKNSENSSESQEISSKIDEILENLSDLRKKSGAVGSRANLFAADLLFFQKKYSESKDAWILATKLKNAYTTPLAFFNAGICAEQLNDFDSAADCYENACKDEDFIFRAHALFSWGRVLEAKNDFSAAKNTYQTLAEKYPQDQWAQLAKSRILALELNEGQ